MSVNKYVQKLKSLHGAIEERYDPWAPSNLLKFSSPSVNWIFGRTHGFPRAFSALVWGEKKAGKSLLFYDLAGRVHQSDPEAIVIKFDTEYRDLGQLPPEMAKAYGIDLERFIVFQTNSAADIFDPLSRNGQITEMLKSGANIPLIGIDSISDVMGRREEEQESVVKHQIGDHAITLQIGLKSILDSIRKYKVGLIMTAHARDEMDQWEIRRGNKKKPAAANAVLHYCEFFINVEKNLTKDGRQDLLEREFVDETKKDMVDSGEQTGHKVRVWMQNSTMSSKGRVAEFTLDYKKGIINQYEEVFRLGLNWGVIGRPSKGIYVIGENKFNGKPACLEALANSQELQQFIMNRLLELENSTNFINGAHLDTTTTEEQDE